MLSTVLLVVHLERIGRVATAFAAGTVIPLTVLLVGLPWLGSRGALSGTPFLTPLILLAAAAASRADWAPEANRCRSLVLRDNPRHLVGKHTSIEQALEHPDYQPFDHQLQRLCPLEKAEWLLQQQEIELQPLSGQAARATASAFLDAIDNS